MRFASLAALVVLSGAVRTEREPSVVIRGFKFRPDTIVVQAGTAATWLNEDDIEHTVTGDTTTARVVFDGALKGKGSSFRAVLRQPGIYPYHCERHQFMTATVRVISPGEAQ